MTQLIPSQITHVETVNQMENLSGQFQEVVGLELVKEVNKPTESAALTII
jgi:hypothetical protein